MIVRAYSPCRRSGVPLTLGAPIALAIAGAGMLMLAFVFQTLSRRRPDLDAGIYAYAKAGFGDYLGFTSAFGFWIACCLADVACLLLIKSTLGMFCTPDCKGWKATPMAQRPVEDSRCMLASTSSLASGRSSNACAAM